MGDFRFSLRHGTPPLNENNIEENEPFIYKTGNNYQLCFKVLNPSYNGDNTSLYDSNNICKYTLAYINLNLDSVWDIIPPQPDE